MEHPGERAERILAHRRFGAILMGRREVTIYSCDGCGTRSTIGRTETPRGYKRVGLPKGEVWLCTVCYGAVEWVARFQGITRPPQAHKHQDGRYRLRREQSA